MVNTEKYNYALLDFMRYLALANGLVRYQDKRSTPSDWTQTATAQLGQHITSSALSNDAGTQEVRDNIHLDISGATISGLADTMVNLNNIVNQIQTELRLDGQEDEPWRYRIIVYEQAADPPPYEWNGKIEYFELNSDPEAGLTDSKAFQRLGIRENTDPGATSDTLYDVDTGENFDLTALIEAYGEAGGGMTFAEYLAWIRMGNLPVDREPWLQ